MKEKLIRLKEHICDLASKETFIHHKWFINWHLNLVEKISMELCETYKEANTDLVLGLVWMHDYAKIVDYDHEHDLNVVAKGKQVLEGYGFDQEYTSKLMNYIDVFESKMTVDLNEAPIEVKIVSSADAASHMIGPFMAIHWYEHPEKSIEQLIEANNKKLNKDWDRKIVLPEVKEAFKKRHEVLKELSGTLPSRLI